MDEFKSLTDIMARARPLSPPGDFSARVMNVIRSRKSAQAGPFRLGHALLQSISLPRSPGQMAMALLNMGFFFLVAGAVLLWGLDFTHTGGAFPPWLLLSPSFVASMGLAFLGWRSVRSPHALATSGLGLAVIAGLFGLSALTGLLFQRPPEPALAGFCLGMSGLAATAFLAVGLGRSLRHPCDVMDAGAHHHP